jgi:hypothetical protein
MTWLCNSRTSAQTRAARARDPPRQVIVHNMSLFSARERRPSFDLNPSTVAKKIPGLSLDLRQPTKQTKV